MGSTPFDISEDGNRFDIEKLQRQDLVEFEKLYQTLAPPLRRYLTHLSGDSDKGFDLSQETFVKVYKALPQIKPEGMRLRPWIYKIATNTAYSAARQRQFKQIFPFMNAPTSKDCSDWSNLSSASARYGSETFESLFAEAEIVIHALKAIKPEYRAVLLLRWREGFSLDELYQILNLSKDNLKKRLYRAKQAFSMAYSKECSTSEEGKA